MKKSTLYLMAAAFMAVGGVLLTLAFQRTAPAENYPEKLQAALRMEAYMHYIVQCKEDRGIPLVSEDIHQTGLIGEDFTGITTTLGALQAKRTAASPDMAALVVELLTRAGVEQGDTVGAGFSGSFPGMNLAVIAACQSMGVELVYISSVGASTYGANQPEFTFPDMALALYQKGDIPSPGAANTLGGDMDCGLDMDEAILAPIRLRLEESGVPLLYEEDYEANLAARMALYEEHGPITCFIGVGGNMTSLGRGLESPPWGVIAPNSLGAVTSDSGLISRYSAQGIDTINLLNIQQLVADYGLPFDPQTLSIPGQSAIYFTLHFPKWPPLLGLGGTAVFLWLYRGQRRKEGGPWAEK